MKITLIASGSRGDVEPYVALAEGLKTSGHVVTIAAEERFKELVTGQGLNFAPMPGNAYAAINSAEGHRALNKKNNTGAFLNHLMNASAPFVTDMLQQSLAACKNAEHIICTHFGLHTAYFVSQQLGIPFSMASVNPLVACNTKYFHNMLFPASAGWLPDFISGPYNSFTHKTINAIWWKTYKKIYANAWKELAGFKLPDTDPVLSGRNNKPFLSLFGYSPLMLPKPPDWGTDQHVCGYWMLKDSETWKPSPYLEHFINSGPPPIYIGFGSMNSSLLKNNELEKLIVEVVARTHQRAVILNQGLNFKTGLVSENIYATGPVPFKYLFPKMRLLVHHGGAGTTASGLAAGVPAIITPLIADQKFWAQRVQKLLPGSEWIAWHSLQSSLLAGAITQTINNKAVEIKAKETGKIISFEKGVEKAVSLFNESI